MDAIRIVKQKQREYGMKKIVEARIMVEIIGGRANYQPVYMITECQPVPMIQEEYTELCSEHIYLEPISLEVGNKEDLGTVLDLIKGAMDKPCIKKVDKVVEVF